MRWPVTGPCAGACGKVVTVVANRPMTSTARPVCPVCAERYFCAPLAPPDALRAGVVQDTWSPVLGTELCRKGPALIHRIKRIEGEPK